MALYRCESYVVDSRFDPEQTNFVLILVIPPVCTFYVLPGVVALPKFVALGKKVEIKLLSEKVISSFIYGDSLQI